MHPASHELLRLGWIQFWQVTALIAAVGLLTRLACQRRPHLAYVLWMLVILKCLVPPILSSPTSVFSWLQARTVQPPAGTPGEESFRFFTGPVLPHRSLAPGPVEEPSASASPGFSASAARGLSAEATTAITQPGGAAWEAWLTAACVAIWVAGVVLFGGVVVARWVRSRRLLEQCAVGAPLAVVTLMAELRGRLRVRRKVRLVVTSPPIGPASLGMLQPTVVLPEVLLQAKAPAQIEPILAHELIHIRRGDVAFGWLQVAAQALWWFHPLVWWASRQCCRQSERCCDEEVIAALGCRPSAYARSLLDVLEMHRAWKPALALLGARPVKVTKKRLEEIMTRAYAAHRHTPRWCWAVLAAVAALVLPGRAIEIAGQTIAAATAAKEGSTMPEKKDATYPSETIVTGRVLDAGGRPVPEARVCIVGRWRKQAAGGDFASQNPQVFGKTQADREGRFRLSVPAVSSAVFIEVEALAVASGHALGFRRLALDVAKPEISIRLPAERPLRGRVLDRQGQPTAAAKVVVFAVGRNLLPSQEGRFWLGDSSSPPPIWPRPAVTDEQGRFTIRGVSVVEGVGVQIFDDRFAQWDFSVEPADEAAAKHAAFMAIPTLAQAGEVVQQKDPEEELTLRPPAAQIFEGRVVCADTGKPVPNARLTLYAWTAEVGGSGMGIAGRADAEGRFRLNPYPGKFFDLAARPPVGEPYLAVEKQRMAWPEGAASQTVELRLPRGVLVRGKITEGPSGQPVAGAGVQYEPRSKNPHATEDLLHGWQSTEVSGADGSFQIAVPAGQGTLFVYGPTANYVARTVDSNEIYYGRPGGQRHYCHGSVALDLKPGEVPQEVSVSLQRGETVKGRVIGPDDKPVKEALLLSRIGMLPHDDQWRAFPQTVVGGEFELSGLDPEKGTPVYFLDPRNRWGAAIEVSGRTPQPLVVRLVPCGEARARFVDPQGKPVADFEPGIHVVMTSGLPRYNSQPWKRTDLIADEDFVANFDRLNYHDSYPKTDAEGRCTFPALIPGAIYRIPMYRKSGPFVGDEFTVQSGKTVELPDITVEGDP